MSQPGWGILPDVPGPPRRARIPGCPGLLEELHVQGWSYSVWVDRTHRIAVLEVPVPWHVVYSVWFWMTDTQWARFRADPVAFEADVDVHAHDHGRDRCKAWLLWDEGPDRVKPLPTVPQPLAAM